MHWIQREILKRLSVADSCRYIELKPDNVDGNLFMYHLKQLIGDGYVLGKDRRYLLTKEGKRFVAGVSLSLGKPTQAPKNFVMIYAKNDKGEYLLYKWSRQPYRGHVSLPFGRTRYGEPLTKAFQENLRYKTGLSGKQIYTGVCEVIVKKGDDVSTHYIAHVFKLERHLGELRSDGLTGEAYWGKINGLSDPETVYGTKEIIKTIESKKSPFFEEILVKKD